MNGINLVEWGIIIMPRSKGSLRVRIARQANTAILGKLIWDFHAQNNKFRANLLTQKYLGEVPILQVQKKNGSDIWDSIMKARNLLQDGYDFRMGNGQSSLWYYAWTDLGPLTKLVPYMDIHDTQMCIVDVIQNGTWRLNGLYTQLPQPILDHIRTLPTYINNVVSDAFWKSKLDGRYTTKGGYHCLLSRTMSNVNASTDTSWN